MYLTYVRNSDGAPLMPCHPARARELVRKGRAYWVRRDTIKLCEHLDHPVLQKVTVGIDSGAEHIGIAAIAERKRKPRVLFRCLVEARPMGEIKRLLEERRSYRRARRSRQWYRQPWLSPTRRVRLSAKVYDKSGQFLYKIPVAEGKRLCKEDSSGRRQAVRIGGNRFRLLTSHALPAPSRESKPGKNDVLVYSVDGRLITWYDPERSDLGDIQKRLLGQSRRHHDALGHVNDEDGRLVIRLHSKSAEMEVPKAALPNFMPPFRKFGQKRKSGGWVSPSANALKDAHIRGLQEVARYVPVTEVRLEVAAFDVRRLEDPQITGVGYQKPEMYAGQNRKDFVLARDRWTCVYCGKKDVPLTVDHVQPRHPSQGPPGPDSIGNLVACCLDCQREKSNLPLEEFLRRCHPDWEKRVLRYIASLPKRNNDFRATAHVGQIKTKLISDLNAQPTWGYVTKRDRRAMHLPKSHDLDAIAIAARGRAVSANLPEVRQFYVRRYASGKASRRQRFKANPLSKKRLHDPGLAPALVGQGKKARWVQQIGVNPSVSTPAGEVRLRDLVTTADGRVGYVMKINSKGSLSLGKRPVGDRENQFQVSAKKIARILRRRRGLLESLEPLRTA